MASFFLCCSCRNSVLVAATIISCLSIVMLCSHVKFNLWILAKSLSAFVQSAVDSKCRQNISPQCQCTNQVYCLPALEYVAIKPGQPCLKLCWLTKFVHNIAVGYRMNVVPEILAQNAPLLHICITSSVPKHAKHDL